MRNIDILKKSLINAIWGMILTFPLAVIKVNTVDRIITWRWYMALIVGVAVFIISILWVNQLDRQKRGVTFKFKDSKLGMKYYSLMEKPTFNRGIPAFILLVALLYPIITQAYTTSIMTTALLYICLGLGLNILVGLGGLLNLGYAAFYAIGAYTYAILNLRFGVDFWIALPLGGIASGLCGLLLGMPVLRLKGDYLAIVTLGFGEITRIIIENFDELTNGPSGIANIPKPSFFGHIFGYAGSTRYIYYLALALVLLVIFIARRLENSRTGRSWIAMREDDIASEAMGIDLTKTKLSLFVISSIVAGIVGVLFSAKTTFINPQSFTVWESITVLCIVVLGGKGSIKGVILGGLIFMLLPEYLRFLSQYRMLMFGFLLVIMMVFRPGGIIQNVRKTYKVGGGKDVN